MNKEQRIWLSAFIEGEGSIVITKTRRDNSSYRFALKVSSNNTETLEYIRGLIELGEVHNPLHIGPILGRGSQLTIPENTAKRVLNELLPYLREKKLEAQLGIQFREHKGHFPSPGRGNKLPTKELQWREMHYRLLKYVKCNSKEKNIKSGVVSTNLEISLYQAFKEKAEKAGHFRSHIMRDLIVSWVKENDDEAKKKKMEEKMSDTIILTREEVREAGEGFARSFETAQKSCFLNPESYCKAIDIVCALCLCLTEFAKGGEDEEK